jgi:hypothetical protein
VSWVSHDLEPYVIQRYMGKKVAFVPLLIGSYAPDLTTKWFVYGVGAFGLELKADDPGEVPPWVPRRGVHAHDRSSACSSPGSSISSGGTGSGR